jgi:hypothetical protein
LESIVVDPTAKFGYRAFVDVTPADGGVQHMERA